MLAGLIGLAFKEAGTPLNKEMLKILKDGGVDQFDEAIAAVHEDFGKVFDISTEKKVKEQLRRVLIKGSDMAGDPRTIFQLTQTKQILEDMVDSTKYFTNRYFNDHVLPELQKIVSDIALEGKNVDVKAYQAVQELMSRRLKNVPYWRVVANASASRGFHYGAVKSGLFSGFNAYKIVAVIDKKTSEICRYMNGREFWLADAELQVVRSAMADGDEIKYVAPWLKQDEILGKSADELRESGFIMPPFHGNCRSTIKFI